MSLISKFCIDHIFLANTTFMINEKCLVLNDGITDYFTTILPIFQKEEYKKYNEISHNQLQQLLVCENGRKFISTRSQTWLR